MPGLAFLRVTSSGVARAAACWVIVAILARPTESALGEGQPYLVKDINPGWMGSSPTSMTKVGDRLFFSADDGVHGREPWIGDCLGAPRSGGGGSCSLYNGVSFLYQGSIAPAVLNLNGKGTSR